MEKLRRSFRDISPWPTWLHGAHALNIWPCAVATSRNIDRPGYTSIPDPARKGEGPVDPEWWRDAICSCSF